MAANLLGDPLPVLAEPVVVVGKQHDLSPPRKLTAHNRSRAVGIVHTTFFKELFRNLRRTNDNNGVPEKMARKNITLINNPVSAERRLVKMMVTNHICGLLPTSLTMPSG